MVSESSFFYYSKFECFNSNYIIVECFKIFKFVWIRLLVADAIKMATKRKHHEVTLKVKYEALKELEKGRPNKDAANQIGIPGSTLATWKKKSLKLFKIYHWNGKEWKLEHTKSQMKPCWSGLHQCVAATFQSVGLFFWRKLMNLLRPSITTIFQHRTDGCSNGCSFLACTILYIVKKHPLLIF